MRERPRPLSRSETPKTQQIPAFRRHATGTTVALISASVLVLSLLPLPDALRPLDFLHDPEPLAALAEVVFRRADSMAGGGGAPAPPPEIAEAADELIKEELEPISPKKRHAWQPPPREKYDKIRAAVGAAPEPVINPCVEGSDQACGRHALDRFFAGLSEVQEQTEGAIVRVVHFGDSLIASDHITDMVRLRLQERFGAGGVGFLMVDRLSRFAGRRVRTGVATEGWKLDVITQSKLLDDYFGYSGASFTSQRAGAASVFEVRGNRMVEIFYLRQPAGGTFEVWADDARVTAVDTKGERQTTIEGLELPQGAKAMRVVAKGEGVRIYGVSMEGGVPGVVYESLGLPGATAAVWLVPREEDFKAQLIHRSPALVVTMLGGNDGLMLSKGRTTLDEIEAKTRTFVQRLRAASPDADCLIVSPMDSARTKGSEIVSKPEVPQIIAVQKAIAHDEECAFWDMWTSMGGTGSLERWWKAGMINPDMIHPKGYGGDLLGEMMVTALMDAFDHWAGRGAAVARTAPSDRTKPIVMEPIAIEPIVLDPIPIDGDDPGAAPERREGEEPRAPLGSFFARLKRLEREREGRAAVAVVGSTNVARNVFTDRVRGGLSARFGYRGRGFAPGGRAAKALDAAGVRRSLSGSTSLVDGRTDTTVGMGGVRADLRRGGSFLYAPCLRCSPSDGPSVFQVFLLVRAGDGPARVEITGLSDDLVPGVEHGEPKMVTRRYSTEAPRPLITVSADSVGRVELLGVSHEIERAGVIVDQIAHPETTVAQALKWDPALMLEMLSERHPDLLVVFLGEVESEASTIDEGAYAAGYGRLLRRLRTGTEDGPCVVLGPLPGLARGGAEGWRPWPAQAIVERVQREAAEAEDCLFWSLSRDLESDREAYVTVRRGDRRPLSDRGLERAAERFVANLMGRYDAFANASRGQGPEAATARTTD
ncbi:MAG: hypothetical protein IT384_31000 [Deltaproteobacteria bacterium]|nr:hypothetical protein [Deltaproteobacteria bacterium]